MSIGQARLSFCVSPSVLIYGIGMLTDCPSPTAFALGLGPTNPPRMTLAAEPSDLRRWGFSPHSRYSSQHSHLSSLQQSSPSAFSARQRSSTKGRSLGHSDIQSACRVCNAQMTQSPIPSVVSVARFSPVIFSAQEHLTSELLRTL
jgi:hypothetical protein